MVATPLVLWRIAPVHTARLRILDKTVPHADYREHNALMWALNHNKTLPPGGKMPWEPGRDYFGYNPKRVGADGKPLMPALSPGFLDGTDALFIADTYGVYSNDYEGDNRGFSPDYSRLIYGGLSESEVGVIEDFSRRGGGVIAEFNTFASPTGGQARKRLEDLLGVRWTGWAGRHFKELSDKGEVPEWARRNYRTHYLREWEFSGPGWLLSSEDTGLLVLESGKDTGGKELEIVVTMASDPLMRGLPGRTPYYYWFDIVSAAGSSEVPAMFRFTLTQSGKTKLAAFKLPESFPAVVIRSLKPLVVYNAGDFSDSQFEMGSYNIFGKPEFIRMTKYFSAARDAYSFFWGFFVQYVENMVDAVERQGAD
jgi:hypothetical protein